MKTVDILRKAKENYINGEYMGMCDCIRNVVDDEMWLFEFDFWVKENIPLFCYTVAVKKFEARENENTYWWNKIDRKSRLDYFDWLIEQYKDK